MKKWQCFMLSLVVIILDQASKYWISVNLIAYKPIAVLPMLNITLAYNTGAAFSFLSGSGEWHRWFLAGFSLLVSILLIVWLLRTSINDKLQSVGISLVLGGALGNLLDRGLYGYVVDFIDVYHEHHHFATFNIADSAISIGAAFMILDLLIHRNE
jgi:signal peptidase II